MAGPGLKTGTDRERVVDVDNVWTIVVMVLIGVPLFLGLRLLATRRAVGRARRRNERRGVNGG